MGTLHAFLPIRRAARRFAKPPDVDDKSRCAGGYRSVKGLGAQGLKTFGFIYPYMKDPMFWKWLYGTWVVTISRTPHSKKALPGFCCVAQSLEISRAWGLLVKRIEYFTTRGPNAMLS